MLDNLRTGPNSHRREWSQLLPSADADAISLISKLITWDPEKRITAERGLMHPYTVQFHEPASEIKWPSSRTLPAAQLRAGRLPRLRARARQVSIKCI